MFLVNHWNNLSIRAKNFIWSTLIIIVAFTVLYLGIYLFMPQIYETYIINKIESNIGELKYTLGNEDVNLIDTLDKFSYENDLDLILVKKHSDNRIQRILYSSFREGIINLAKIPFLKEYNKHTSYELNILREFKIPNEIYKPVVEDDTLNIEQDIFIKSLNNTYTLITHFSVRPIDEAATILTLFFPFAAIAIILIAITVGTFYSIYISKPLIKINKVAKQMAELNFENYIEIKGNDEIGQLSNSLNKMNANLKKSFEKLEGINEKLEQEIELERRIEKERRTFIATISHELKSPITIISGQLEGMIYNIGKYKDKDRYLKESYNVTQTMRKLVEELLYISEKENNDYKCIFSMVNLSKMLEEILVELSYFYDEKDIILKKAIENDVYCMGDKNLLKKAFTNIIKNAILHSPVGENVEIILNNESLKVINTGVTIEQKELDEIFKAFYRIDKSRNRKTGGTGLGLYIVKNILDQHKNIEYSISSKDNVVVFEIVFKN